ncbi:hypothetical protein [Mangrovibrevibacter kandeliae]|uniref:hypothetical protein n=1 Tax=Mangrovibrevibacter kandeliae TaxID=2968473 RepID=UPI002118E28F|nr:hypothetical protein [Aurantimonas sp. CSK15Z-1]MCQ8781917.1 hypothetical protein [Aurantimonas sp. CSK15Z-1]
MTTLLRFIFVIPLGFVAACVMAAFTLLWPFVHFAGVPPENLVFWFHAAVGFLRQTQLVATAIFVPWAVFMTVTEVAGLNSLLLHLVGGLVAGFGVSRLAYGAHVPALSVQTAIIVAGLVFALVYWIVAGHAAGRWRRRYRRVRPLRPALPPPADEAPPAP